MTDQTCGVVAALDAEIIGEENAGYSAAHLKDIRDRVAELIAADVEVDTIEGEMARAYLAGPRPGSFGTGWELRDASAREDRERRLESAHKRRAAALAACKGGA